MKRIMDNVQINMDDNSYKATLCIIESDLDFLKRNAHNYLSTHETDVFASFEYERRQLSYLLGRFAMKEAVSEHLQIEDKKTIEIKSGVLGQPIISTNDSSAIVGSIAHVGNFAVALVFPQECPLGIDLEVYPNKNYSAIFSQLTKSEKELTTPNCIEKSTLLIWTAKESISKVLRTGLTLPLSILEVQRLSYRDSMYFCSFSNFSQYEAVSIATDTLILTFAKPTKSELVFSSNNKFIDAFTRLRS